MTDQELLALRKVGPAEAARYLQNGTTAQDIRLDAQEGHCPFCSAEKMRGRHRYRINVGMLIRFKHGLPCDGMPIDANAVNEGEKSTSILLHDWELLSTNTSTQEYKDIMWEVVIRSWKKRDHIK